MLHHVHLLRSNTVCFTAEQVAYTVALSHGKQRQAGQLETTSHNEGSQNEAPRPSCGLDDKIRKRKFQVDCDEDFHSFFVQRCFNFGKTRFMATVTEGKK